MCDYAERLGDVEPVPWNYQNKYCLVNCYMPIRAHQEDSVLLLRRQLNLHSTLRQSLILTILFSDI